MRGIGSLYYLMYALQYDWPLEQKEELGSLVLAAVTISILVHGVSATHLMDHDRKRKHGIERKDDP